MVRTDKVPRKRLDPDDRRTTILQAAIDTFGKTSYSDVTIAKIAAASEASDALIYRYFGNKEDLYVAALQATLDQFKAAQLSALDNLSPGAPVRDRVRILAVTHLEHVAASHTGSLSPISTPGFEPPAAAAVRHRAEQERVVLLRNLLHPSQQKRHEYALWSFYGSLDSTSSLWASRGCPQEDLWPIVDTVLGALEGSLGDWAA